MPVLICRPSQKGARGVKVKIIALFLLAFFVITNICLASNKNSPYFEDGFCTNGSHKQLYKFFTQNDYVVVAQGKRIHANNKVKDFADILLLVSADMEYFHVVTLNGIKYDHFKVCIFSSAREIDYQFASPIPNILTRKNREHVVLLTNDISINASCPDNEKYCTPWKNWSENLKQTFLLSAYTYSSKWENNPYNQIVELALDNKTIHATRGALSEHACKKYALRLRNTLDESEENGTAAKNAYKQIHREVDHKLTLTFLSLTEARDWTLSQVDRKKGLVETILYGIELELYPMPNSAYKEFLKNTSP